MLVSFVTVKQKENALPIKELCREFSRDMPRPLPLEGGQGINYVICLPITNKNDIEGICNKNKYTITEFKELEVDLSHYNSNYNVGMKYFEDPMYVLENIYT